MAVTQNMLNSLEWRCIGPPRGGRVVAVAGDPVNPAVFYFGACAGGVWKTDDAGTYWQNVSDGFFKTASVGAIEVAPSDPNVIYAGMGEACIRLDVSHGDGVYRSTDAGKTWSHLGLQDTRHIARVRVHPLNPDIVYVAALGHAFGPNEQRGIFRSTVGGKTWEHVLSKGQDAGAADLSMDPNNPRVLFAAIWEARRTFWSMSSGGSASGLYRSTDGGDTWTDITNNPGLPKGLKGRIGVAVSPAKAGRVWATVEAEGLRAVPLGRRRRHLGAGQRRPRPAGATLVLPARLRRPSGRRHGVDPELPVLQVDRRRQELHAGVDASRRQSRPVGLTRAIHSE